MAATHADCDMSKEIAGKKLFAQIEQTNFSGFVETLSKSNMGLEYLDENSNSPVLYACYFGRYPFVKYLVEFGANYKRINVFGQNALSMATYSGDQKTCEYLLSLCSIEEYNSTCICPPLCVAVIVENVALVRFFMKIESNGIASKFGCQSNSMHGTCPLKLALLQKHKQIVDLLRPVHEHHI